MEVEMMMMFTEKVFSDDFLEMPKCRETGRGATEGLFLGLCYDV
jgi:hypothetical protein